jgi:hypothetical protein
MRTNLGTADKAVRITAAVVLAAMYFTGSLTGIPGIIALAVAGILFLTSLLGYCPLYGLFKWNTKSKGTRLG